MYLHVSDWANGARVAGSANDDEALNDVKACIEQPPRIPACTRPTPLLPFPLAPP